MKRRLLMTASTFPRWEGDGEPRFILDLAKALQPYYDVTVLAPSAPGAAKKETLEGVHVVRYRYFPVKKWETLCYPGAIAFRIKEKKARALLVPFLFAGLWLKLLRMQKDYDIIHGHWLIPQGIIHGLFRKPMLITCHGSDVRAMNKFPILNLKKRCLKRAAAVTAVSDYLAGQVKELCGREDIRVLPMGCHTGDFTPDKRQEQLFRQGDKQVVLFAGRLSENKGVRYLVDAMKSIPNAKLVIAGDGPERAALEAQAAANGIDAQFLGNKTHEELAVIYASADVLCAPSVIMPNGAQEGFGLVLVEAMASGLPVVGTATGGIPTIVKDGRNGLLVPDKDSAALAGALQRILSLSPDERRAYAACARETALQFDYEVIGREYARVLDGVK
ncbi:MAG: glycosyltransferase [Clostridia bacterium]|nr:glycosyltransferase [Clostridia bacterium]